jgi:hypothetical protein
MADAVEAAQALHIDVKQVARTIALVAHGWRRGIELLESTDTGSPADSSSRRCTDTDSSSDLPHGKPLPTQLDDAYPRRGTRGETGRGARASISTAHIAQPYVVRRSIPEPAVMCFDFKAGRTQVFRNYVPAK